MKQVGLHIRITHDLYQVIEEAQQLQMPIFQCFLLHQQTKKLIKPSREERDFFVNARNNHFASAYAHGSYLINMASVLYQTQYRLIKELELATQLSFTHFVLHCGSAKGAVSAQLGIDAVARVLNSITKKYSIRILLENTAHANLNIGSNIADFKLIKEKLDAPEKVGFCIDTAHAFAYGYDIITAEGLKDFVQLIDSSIGIETVELIHLNDLEHERGARLDHHVSAGNGAIGMQGCKQFVQYTPFNDLPIIMEPPIVDIVQQQQLLELVRGWK